MLPLQDQLFVVQSDIIKDIASKENCVIVGRCADFILRDVPDSLHVFIHGNMENKAERAVKEYGFAPEDVEKTIRKRDKARANHYKYYTDYEWGKAQNYDMTLNSSTFGIEGCVNLLYDVATKE